jgi:hypothetical protein
MTLTPSVRAISLCSFPCVARSFARASFDAISTFEYLFFLAIAASLRPLPTLQIFIAHYYKGTRCSLAGSGTRNRQLRKAKQIDWGLPKKTDSLAIAKKRPDDCNHRRAAGLTMRCAVCRNGM